MIERTSASAFIELNRHFSGRSIPSDQLIELRCTQSRFQAASDPVGPPLFGWLVSDRTTALRGIARAGRFSPISGSRSRSHAAAATIRFSATVSHDHRR